MTVNHYVWGEVSGGCCPDSGGSAAVPAEASYGPEESFSGAIGAATVTINFTRATKNVSVYNTHDLEEMEVSFDGGIDWVPIDPNGMRTEPLSLNSLQLRRTGAGNPTYTVVAVLTS